MYNKTNTVHAQSTALPISLAFKLIIHRYGKIHIPAGGAIGADNISQCVGEARILKDTVHAELTHAQLKRETKVR